MTFLSNFNVEKPFSFYFKFYKFEAAINYGNTFTWPAT